jgi:shikimate kinase
MSFAREQQRIVLTGFMGAGKTTVAAALARRLNCAFVDLDEMIERAEQRSVPALIREEGEAQFRVIETLCLRRVLEEQAARVIALGGGTWTLSENRAFIIEHDGFAVWLDAPFELCWQRIKDAEGERPLAQDIDAARRLFDERRPVYELAALRVAIKADRDPDEVASEIVRALSEAARCVKN